MVQERSIEKHQIKNLSRDSQPRTFYDPKCYRSIRHTRRTLISTCVTALPNCSLHVYGFSLDLHNALACDNHAEMSNPWLFNPYIEKSTHISDYTLSSVCRTKQLNLKGSQRQHGACIRLSQSGPNSVPDTEEEASQQWSKNQHEPP